MIGAIRNRPLLALVGMMVSLRKTFSPSAKLCSSPHGPTTFGPAAKRHRRPDLAIGIDDHRHRQHQRQRDEQDADERGEEPRPVVGHAVTGTKKPVIPPPPRTASPWSSSAEQRCMVGLARQIGVGQVEVLDRIADRALRLGVELRRRPRQVDQAVAAELRDSRRPSPRGAGRSCRTAAACRAARETARRIVQSSRASPGGNAAFSPRCTRPSVLT